MITVIGLGTEKDGFTMKAWKALQRADKVLLRTQFPCAESLKEAGIAFDTLDAVYEKSRNYDTLAKNLAAEVVRQSEGCELCYCVDGGVSEDRAARLLLNRKDVKAIDGVSKGERAAARARLTGAYQSVSAFELSGRELALPLVVYDVASREIAGDIKLLLAERFGDEAPALYLHGDGQKEIPLFEADRQEAYGAETALVVFDMPLLQKKRFGFSDVVEILRRLRAPDGCPWDRAQTHASIRINALEEAYELVDAIDRGDPDRMREEAGDVLMQALFHTLIEEERGAFTVTDVLSELCEKLITRHTHVFGQDKASGADGALSVWDKNKMAEKGQKTYSDAVNDVPECFPALLRAQKIAKRVCKGGWNFTSFEKNLDKLYEEIDELKEAEKSGNKSAVAAELGDVYMTLAHVAHGLGTDSEQALLDTVKKVAARYNEWEKLVLADGKDVHDLSDEEWLFYYRKAKAAVKA